VLALTSAITGCGTDAATTAARHSTAAIREKVVPATPTEAESIAPLSPDTKPLEATPAVSEPVDENPAPGNETVAMSASSPQMRADVDIETLEILKELSKAWQGHRHAATAAGER